jgi:hypothetical protein
MGPSGANRERCLPSFADGWQIESVEAATLEVTLPIGAAAAWLAVITRVPDDQIMAIAE